MNKTIWWGKQIVIGCLSLFFLVFGADALIGAYSLKNPLEFIMYFFSSSFIILISIVGIIYPAFQIHRHIRTKNEDAGDHEDTDNH